MTNVMRARRRERPYSGRRHHTQSDSITIDSRFDLVLSSQRDMRKHRHAIARIFEKAQAADAALRW